MCAYRKQNREKEEFLSGNLLSSYLSFNERGVSGFRLSSAAAVRSSVWGENIPADHSSQGALRKV